MWAPLCHLFAAAVSILLVRQTGGGGATNSYEDFLVVETVLGIRVDYHLFRTALVFSSTHDAHAFAKLKLRIRLRLMAG